MKKSGYMDRALRSADPRYARVLSKLGYGRSDMTAAAKPKSLPSLSDITMLRAEYERIVGKKPFMGWDETTLRQKIAEAKS